MRSSRKPAIGDSLPHTTLTPSPVPARPGRKVRHDYEHARNGVANLFMMFAPLEGRRHVKVTDRHAVIDYAHALKDFSDTHFPDATKIVLGAG